MLTVESIIEHAEIEYQRSRLFRAYVAETLGRLRPLYPALPESDLSALRVLMSNGAPLAKALLDGFYARCPESQWVTADAG